jgi:hypothetical protein
MVVSRRFGVIDAHFIILMLLKKQKRTSCTKVPLTAAEGSRLPVALVLRAPSRPATLPAGGIHAAFSSVDAATSLRLLHYFKKNI